MEQLKYSDEAEKIKQLLAHLQKSDEKLKVDFASDIGTAMLFQQIPEHLSAVERREFILNLNFV